MGAGRKFIFAIVAVLATAVIGAALALAESGVMCKASEKVCSGANTYPGETTLTANVHPGFGEARVGTAIWTSKCKKSSIAGKTSKGTSATGQITSLTFGECSDASAYGCVTVSALNLPYAFEVLTEAPKEAEAPWTEHLRLTSGGSGNPTIKFTCTGNGGFTCTYAAESVEGKVVGGAPAAIYFASQLQLVAWTPLFPKSCPSSPIPTHMMWEGPYTIEKPNPLYLRP